MADQQPPARTFLVERPAVIVGFVGAVVALAGLAEWSPASYVFIRQALIACSGLLALLAFLSIRDMDTRADKRELRIGLTCLLVALLVAGFWAFTYGTLEREANMIADVVTAVAFVVLGLVIGSPRPIGPGGQWNMIVLSVAAIGAIVFAIWSSTDRLEDQRAWQECLDDAESLGEPDPVEWCRSLYEKPDDGGGRFG